jgi:hypothetical protein
MTVPASVICGVMESVSGMATNLVVKTAAPPAPPACGVMTGI